MAGAETDHTPSTNVNVMLRGALHLLHHTPSHSGAQLRIGSKSRLLFMYECENLPKGAVFIQESSIYIKVKRADFVLLCVCC
jgi:hypothetical protein